MHKTMLAALIVGASALGIPAFAQVNLGGTAQAGAGVRAGATVPGALHAADHAGMRSVQTLHRANHGARHLTHKTLRDTRPATSDQANGRANVNADGSIGGAHANADAGIDTANSAGKAGDAGLGVGGDVRDAAHSAISATDRSAGSVGDAASQTATGQSVGADARVNARAAAHGH